jgi:nucleoid-associated protein Lsr2
MAQTVIITVTDDLDGSPEAETVKFGFDGTTYEIDLSPANQARLREAFGLYIPHARKAGGAGGGTRRHRSTADRQRSDAVRTWARQQGIKVGPRGRIPASVTARYDEAHA